MKKLLLSLILFFLFSASSYGQILWQNTYGRPNSLEIVNKMISLSNGGYLLTGYQNFNSAIGAPVYTVKTNPIGDTLWTKRHFPPGFIYSTASAACEDAQGNYVLVGYGYTINQPKTDYHGFIIKLNSNGDTIWTHREMTSLDDRFINVVLSNDSGYVVAGKHNGQNYIFKYNPNGSLRWKIPHQFSVTDTGTFIGLHKVATGYFLFIGSHYTTALTRVIRVDENGNELYHKFNNHYGIARIANEPAGNILFAIGGKLVKLNQQGDTLWSKFYKIGTKYTAIKAVQPTDDGNYILLIDRHNNMDYDIGLIKVNPNGAVIKDTILFRPFFDENSKDIELDANGNYVIAGYTSTSTWGDTQLFLVSLKKWTKTTVGLKENLPETVLHVYPNPATNQVLITGEQDFTGTFTLHNLQGQKLWQKEVNHATEQVVPLQNLPKGIYLLQYLAEDGRQVSKRIMRL